MRVLFQARQDIVFSRGGDAMQLRATQKHLIKRGVEVDFDASSTSDCSSYDIVHLFNMTRPYETSLHLENAKSYGKPVCLSTIYWNMDESRSEIRATTPFGLRLVRIMRRPALWLQSLFGLEAKNRYRENQIMSSPKALKQLQAKLIEGTDMLLPNSQAELCLLQRDFPMAQSKCCKVVHNCIDGEVFDRESAMRGHWGRKSGLTDYIVCAGRFEPRKNQVRLLRAMVGSDIPMVLVGSVASRAYFAEMSRYTTPKTRLLSEVPQSELRDIYVAARVHVLPSLYETPGLASLEAGAMGCNLVMSEIGSQREYFGDRVEYCDAYSENSIRSAVERAWARPWPNSELAAFVRANYVWEIAARETHEAYEQVLSTIC